LSLISLKREKLFPINLYWCKSDLPHAAIEDYVRDKLGQYTGYTSFYDDEFNREMQFGQPFAKEMEEDMRKLSASYLQECGVPIKYYKDEKPKWWYSLYHAGDDHCVHNHPKSIAAGTYYPYADKDSSSIRFSHPVRGLMDWINCYPTEGGPIGDADNGVDLYRKSFCPETGAMAVWPSWLDHEVKPQKPVSTDKARIAISWNFG